MAVATPQKKAEDHSSVSRFGSLAVDAESMVATLNGKPLVPTEAEFIILARLAVKPPEVVSSLELYRLYTGYPSATKADAYQAVKQHVFHLRRKLTKAGGQVEIVNIRGTGYYLVRRESKERQASVLSVVVVSEDLKLLNSKILPICGRIRASQVEKYGRPCEVLADLESRSFPQTDLILTAVVFSSPPADVGTDHDVFSMVRCLQESGVAAPIIALDAFGFCDTDDLCELKELGVIVERTKLDLEKKTVFQLYATIQQILDSQA